MSIEYSGVGYNSKCLESDAILVKWDTWGKHQEEERKEEGKIENEGKEDIERDNIYICVYIYFYMCIHT